MEPTSNSQPRESTGVSDSADPDHICRVCHQPVPRQTDQRRESLVHRACLAELRCGVTLGGPTDEQIRERDTI